MTECLGRNRIASLLRAQTTVVTGLEIRRCSVAEPDLLVPYWLKGKTLCLGIDIL